MDVDGEVELCLGAVAESYPPQCSGIPVVNWSWEGVEGSESSGDVTWGSYAVQGTYDGEQYTVSAPPIMLALYDPMAFPDPTNGEPGAGDEATLLEIQEDLPGAARRCLPVVATPRTAGCGSTSCGMTARGRMPRTPTTARTS